MAEKKTIQFLLQEGTLEGILMANDSNGIATVSSSPIEKIGNFYKLQEANKAGVYFCLGEEKDKIHIYVGQAKIIKTRLQWHANNDDWWPEIFKIISIASKEKSLLLGATERNHLEHRFIEIAKEAGLESYNIHDKKHEDIDSTKKTTLDKFIDEVLLLLDVMDIRYFQKGKNTSKKKISVNDGESNEDTSHKRKDYRRWNSKIAEITFYLKREYCYGELEWREPENIVLLKGTELSHYYSNDPSGERARYLKKEWRKDGYIQGDEVCKNITPITIQDAACIVLGRGDHAWRVWKTEEGETLDDVCKRLNAKCVQD